MSERPNILFIITDQLRADSLGCYGHPVIKTPNIDEIAANGTRFDECHAASPVCMPNRASLMTGRYPSVHGLRHNGCHLPTNASTFVEVLASAGYHTAGIGKSHLQPFTGIPAESRVDEDALGSIAEAVRVDIPGLPEEVAHLNKQETLADFQTPYYGFQHIDILTAHGFKSGGHYIQWLLEREPNGLELLKPANQLDHNYSCPQAIRLPIPEHLYTTSYVKEKSLEYLDERAGNDSPFFAFVSFNDPHHPFNPPGKYWEMYNPDDFPLPPDYDQLVNPISPLQKVRAQYLAGESPKTFETVFMATPQQIQQGMALTAGLITMIDDAVGEIVNQLKATGQYDNTIIIFTSDHGDYLGDYSMMLKGALPYRGITRVPFIWSEPHERVARQSKSFLSTVDIAPSLISRTGCKPYWGIQGKDISSLVASPELAVRDHLLVEYEDGMTRFGFDSPAMVRSLISPEYRLTVYRNQDFGELYNLTTDSYEACNLFNKEAYRAKRHELTDLLVQEMMNVIETSPRASRRA